MTLRRRDLLRAGAVAGAAGLAGCLDALGSIGERDVPSSGNPPTAETTLHVHDSFERLRDNTISGGPPKDGIPSIDDPSFADASSAPDRLADDDVVFGVVNGGEAKAYPQYIVVVHEIVNDVVGGDPVAVTYCPLTGTAMGFDRGPATFGVSGNLVNSNLVMYDRGVDSRWPQVLATAVKGEFRGESLREVPVTWTTWGRWKAVHPDTRVLTEDTGHARDYDRDPYGSYNPRGGYYRNERFLFDPIRTDDRLHPKAVVIGARTAEGAVAFGKDRLRREGVVDGSLVGSPVVAVHDRALDTAYVYRNPEELAFERTADGIRGPEDTYAPDALPLERLLRLDAMWFAWAAFYPETSLHA